MWHYFLRHFCIVCLPLSTGCGPLSAPNNINISYSRRFAVDSVATFNCNGSLVERVCTMEGWSGSDDITCIGMTSTPNNSIWFQIE